jgi:hypothetical protein
MELITTLQVGTSALSDLVKATPLARRLVPQSGPFAAPAQTVAAGPPQSASQALLDLRVPTTVRDALESPLKDLGFDLCDDEKPQKYGERTRHFSVAKKQAEERILIHVDSKILSEYTDEHFDALASLPWDFIGSTLFVFSPPLDAAEFTLRRFLEDGWKAQQVTVVFIPWRDIDDLQGANSQTKQRKIKVMLKLNGFHPFFDVGKFPWSRDEAIAFHRELSGAITVPAVINRIYLEAGGVTAISLAAGRPDLIWQEVIDQCAAQKLLRQLCQRLERQPEWATLAPFVRAIQSASIR